MLFWWNIFMISLSWSVKICYRHTQCFVFFGCLPEFRHRDIQQGFPNHHTTTWGDFLESILQWMNTDIYSRGGDIKYTSFIEMSKSTWKALASRSVVFGLFCTAFRTQEITFSPHRQQSSPIYCPKIQLQFQKSKWIGVVTGQAVH